MLPLSHQQERLWFLHQLEPTSSAYHIAGALELRGSLEPDAFAAGLVDVAQRHEILRSTIVVDGLRPVHRISDEAVVDLRTVDLTQLEGSLKVERARAAARTVGDEPFDLATGPLFRCLLARLGPDVHWFVLVLHHLVADEQSGALIVRDLAHAYNSKLRGLAPAWARAPRHRDYVEWQRQNDASGVVRSQVEYWKDRLVGSNAGLSFPTDHPRSPFAGSAGGTEHFSLPSDLVARMRELCRSENVTVFSSLLAVLQILLYRYSQDSDVSIGVPVSDRRRVEFEELVGFLVNTVVVREALDPRMTFRQLVHRTQDAVLDAYENQDVPLDTIISELGLRRSPSHNPLFQVMFAMVNRVPAMTWEGLEATVVDLHRSAAMFELSLCCWSSGDSIEGHVTYRTALFETATIRRLLGHYIRLIESALECPDDEINSLAMMSRPELAELLDGSISDRPVLGSVHDLFAHAAAKWGDATALHSPTRDVSFAELAAWSDAIARELLSLGVARGDIVGVVGDRRPAMVAALLGVMKAGAAYMGLDVRIPAARTLATLRDLGVRAIVCFDRGSIPFHGADVPHVVADRIPDGAATDVPLRSVGADDLAYVIRTSGSTGRPKVVGITHANAVGFIEWSRGFFSHAALTSVLATTSPIFDCTLFEVFAPLCEGGTVVLRRDLAALAQEPAAVTLLHTTPTNMSSFLRGSTLPETVQAIVLAGDVVDEELVRKLDEVAPNADVYNFYGPSETTTFACGGVIDSKGAASGRPVKVNIGHPIGGARAYVVDRHLDLLPSGVPGELCIGGAGIGRGYLGSPGLTAERFVPDPWASRAGARVYRTGDRVRRTAEGALEFLGRSDREAKVNGVRVDPAEIEAAIRSLTGVHDCFVDAPGVPGRDRRLVAYVEAEPGADLSDRELEVEMAKILPSYVMPAAVVPLPTLPRLVNGKVDRRSLPRPRHEGNGSTPSETALEAVIASLWRGLLRGVERVPRATSFYRLGGDSLKGAILVHRVEETFGTSVSLSDFLIDPTVAGMARLLGTEKMVPALAPSSVRERPLFLLCADVPTAVATARVAEAVGRRLVVLPLGVTGDATDWASLQDVASLCAATIKSLQPTGPYAAIAGVDEASVVAYETARSLSAAGETVEILGLLNPGVAEDRASGEVEDGAGRPVEVDFDPAEEERARLRRVRSSLRAAVSRCRPEPFETTCLLWHPDPGSEAARSWRTLFPAGAEVASMARVLDRRGVEAFVHAVSTEQRSRRAYNS